VLVEPLTGEPAGVLTMVTARTVKNNYRVSFCCAYGAEISLAHLRGYKTLKSNT